MLHHSPAFFAQEILNGNEGEFFVGEHHQEWDKLLTQYDRICVLAARGHGKTYYFNFAYPLWRCHQYPGSIGFIFSATANQAQRILGDIKDEIERNPKLQHLLPKTNRMRWSAGYIRLANDSRIYARGYGTKVRGAHPTWIVVDDGLNDETLYSELIRQKEIDYFLSAITNMILPGGQIIVVGTPMHQADLYDYLKKNDEYKFDKYPAIKKDGKALWPQKFPLPYLERRRREIGSLRFARELLCEPITDDMSLFPRRLFQGDPTEQPNVKLGMPLEYWKDAGINSIFIGVDFAMSSSVQADYTVIFVMGLDSQGNRWIIDIARDKGLEYQTQLSMINEMGRKYDPSLIFLEDNQMQRIFGDELIRTTDLPIKKFTTTGTGKNCLEKGIPSLRVLLENKKFRIPRGDARSVELTNLWIDECQSFTWTKTGITSTGDHDDLTMACWICDRAIKSGAFGFTFGDEEEYAQKIESQSVLSLERREGGNGGGSGKGNGSGSGSGKGKVPPPLSTMPIEQKPSSTINLVDEDESVYW